MSRQLRIEFPGAIYLVTTAGNAGHAIFRDDGDREVFLETVSEVVLKYSWTCHAYSLMTDHYQLLVETPQANLSRGMRHLNGVFTQRFNSRHRQSGHIFHGRFKALLVEKERYFLEVCRHVVTAPVRERMVGSPADWPWSSYRATAAIDASPYFLTTAEIVRIFRRGGDPVSGYREYVAGGAEAFTLDEMVRGQIFLGSEAFVEHIRKLPADVGRHTVAATTSGLRSEPGCNV